MAGTCKITKAGLGMESKDSQFNSTAGTMMSSKHGT